MQGVTELDFIIFLFLNEFPQETEELQYSEVQNPYSQ